MLTVDLTKELIARDILVLTAGCSSGGLENCGLMTPEAASLAGPKLRAVCESLGIPPALNFGPCLAIGRPEMVATELARALNVEQPGDKGPHRGHEGPYRRTDHCEQRCG